MLISRRSTICLVTITPSARGCGLRQRPARRMLSPRRTAQHSSQKHLCRRSPVPRLRGRREVAPCPIRKYIPRALPRARRRQAANLLASGPRSSAPERCWSWHGCRGCSASAGRLHPVRQPCGLPCRPLLQLGRTPLAMPPLCPSASHRRWSRAPCTSRNQGHRGRSCGTGPAAAPSHMQPHPCRRNLATALRLPAVGHEAVAVKCPARHAKSAVAPFLVQQQDL